MSRSSLSISTATYQAFNMSAASAKSMFSCDVGENLSLLNNQRGLGQETRIFKRIRKIKSKGALLNLLLAFLVYCGLFSSFKMATELNGRYFHTQQLQLFPGILGFTIFTIFCPIAGWLADVYFSRYKVMRLGLWIMWIGAIVEAVVLILLSQYRDTKYIMAFLTVVASLIGYGILPVAFAAFAVNTVQFGFDQMPEASAEETSAFIHWFSWVALLAFSVGGLTQFIYYCVQFETTYISACVQVLVPLVLLTFAVCCNHLFRGWLTIEPESQNPLKTVFGVLKFAATHKHPIRRRAITYCEDAKPSRIDFAKDKYGGPYTTEQVEDVKTFFRIATVSASTSLFLIPLLLYLISQTFISYHGEVGEKYDKMNFHGSCREETKWFGCSHAIFAVVMIPLYEFLIYPLLRNKIPSTLQRVVIAAVLTVILSGTILIIDTVEHARKPSLSCMFNDTKNVLNPYSIQFAIPLNFLVAIQLVLYLSAIVEFICAQSPYNMRGLLIGLGYSLSFLTFPLAYAIFIIWYRYSEYLPSSPSCDFYYFLFQFVFAVVGLAVLCIVTKWYKMRQRDDLSCQQVLVESIFERRLCLSNTSRRQNVLS